MSVSLLSENEFSIIKEDWNHLLQESSNNEFFLTWEWVFTWWDIYGKGKELFILIIKDENGELVGIAPWYIKNKEIRFIGTGGNVAPEYLNIIIKKGYEASVIKELFSYLKAMKSCWSVVYLSDIIENHVVTGLMLKEAKNEGMPVYKNCNGAPCVCLPLPRESSALWEQLSSKFRYNVKRGRKKIHEMQGNRVRIFLDEPMPQTLMADIFRLHNKRMEEKGGTGKFNSDNYRQFHIKLLEGIPTNTAVAILESNGKPAAMIYGYHYANKIYFYQSGFDPESELRKYSPVQLLLSYVIEKAIDIGCTEFDFLRGDEEYKYRWTSREKKKENVVIFNRFSRSGKLFTLKFILKNKVKNIARPIIKIKQATRKSNED